MSGASQIVKATHPEPVTLCRKNDIKRNVSYPIMVLALACRASVSVHAGVEVAFAQTKQRRKYESERQRPNARFISCAKKRYLPGSL